MCSAKGFPFPHVSWDLTNKVSQYSDKSSRLFLTFDDLPNVYSTIELEDVVPELSGNYTCRASVPGRNEERRQFLTEAKANVEVIVSSKWKIVFLENLLATAIYRTNSREPVNLSLIIRIKPTCIQMK